MLCFFWFVVVFCELWSSVYQANYSLVTLVGPSWQWSDPWPSEEGQYWLTAEGVRHHTTPSTNTSVLENIFILFLIQFET